MNSITKISVAAALILTLAGVTYAAEMARAASATPAVPVAR